jgi:hypothetical protein
MRRTISDGDLEEVDGGLEVGMEGVLCGSVIGNQWPKRQAWRKMEMDIGEKEETYDVYDFALLPTLKNGEVAFTLMPRLIPVLFVGSNREGRVTGAICGCQWDCFSGTGGGGRSARGSGGGGGSGGVWVGIGGCEDFFGFGLLGGSVRNETGKGQGLRKEKGRNRLVFEEGDLAARYVEALLLGLSKVGALVDRELGVVDEGIGKVIVFRSEVFLLIVYGKVSEWWVNERDEKTDLFLRFLVLVFFRTVVGIAVTGIAALGGCGDRRGRALSRCLGERGDVNFVVVWATERDLETNCL